MENLTERTALESFNHFLLYDGSILDIIINHSLILFYSFIFYYPWKVNYLIINKIFITVHILICIILQVSVWFLADAYGVSLIWSGQLGLLIFITLMVTYKLKSLTDVQLHLVLVMAPGVGGVLYYALVFPPITTVAHLTAVFVGCMMATTSLCICKHGHNKSKQ